MFSFAKLKFRASLFSCNFFYWSRFSLTKISIHFSVFCKGKMPEISQLWPSYNDDDIFFSQIARYISYCGKVYLFEIVTFLMFDLFVGTIFVTS